MLSGAIKYESIVYYSMILCSNRTALLITRTTVLELEKQLMFRYIDDAFSSSTRYLARETRSTYISLLRKRATLDGYVVF